MTKSKQQTVYLAKIPKTLKDMTRAERRAWAWNLPSLMVAQFKVQPVPEDQTAMDKIENLSVDSQDTK